MKNAVFWNLAQCGSCLTDVSQESVVSVFSVESAS
jgi:hypothetical protein